MVGRRRNISVVIELSASGEQARFGGSENLSIAVPASLLFSSRQIFSCTNQTARFGFFDIAAHDFPHPPQHDSLASQLFLHGSTPLLFVRRVRLTLFTFFTDPSSLKGSRSMTERDESSGGRFAALIVILICGGYLAAKALRHFSEEDLRKPPSESPVALISPARPIPAAFQSKIILPSSLPEGEKALAPAGVFYPLKRISRKIRDGVYAVVPGEELRLLKRMPEGHLLLLNGSVEFLVQESQVTNDLKLAQEAERQEYARHFR